MSLWRCCPCLMSESWCPSIVRMHPQRADEPLIRHFRYSKDVVGEINTHLAVGELLNRKGETSTQELDSDHICQFLKPRLPILRRILPSFEFEAEARVVYVLILINPVALPKSREISIDTRLALYSARTLIRWSPPRRSPRMADVLPLLNFTVNDLPCNLLPCETLGSLLCDIVVVQAGRGLRLVVD